MRCHECAADQTLTPALGGRGRVCTIAPNPIRKSSGPANGVGHRALANATMQIRRAVRALFMALVFSLLIAPSTDAAAQTTRTLGTPIYVLRGALGIFSSGMDALADEMNDIGLPAVSQPFENWRSLTDRIVKAYRAQPYPIALVGHSWGANTILLMAYELEKQHIPVALLVFYDITNSARIPPNVKWVVNYRSTSAIGGEVKVVGGHGFSGVIDNITLPDLNHVEIDKNESLHQWTIYSIKEALGLHR